MPPQVNATSPGVENILKAFKEDIEAAVNGENGKAEDTPSRKREAIGRADQIYNKSKRKWEFFKAAKPASRKARFTKYVILVRTVWSAKGVPAKVEIDVKGELLQQALIDINKDTKAFVLDKSNEIVDRRLLFHSKSGLQSWWKKEKANDDPDEDMIFELEAGLQFIEEEYSMENVSLCDFLPKRLITFPLLWALFPPNVLAVGQDEFKQTFAFFVREVFEGEDQQGNAFLSLNCAYLDHDGEALKELTGFTLKIYGFEGARGITSLPYYPLDMHEHPEQLKQYLLKNARAAMKVHGRHLVEYTGHALREGKDSLVKFNSHGRVMLDPVTLVETVPSNGLMRDSMESIKTTNLSDEQIMTISPKLYGFSLGDKTWGIFAVTHIHEVIWNDQVFDSLVLEQERKDLIHDLVQTHRTADDTFDDFVRLKGKGLVGLLAGPPGVGKTMTAEAIAEVARRPLYMISSGELGEAVEDIHDKLKTILELAELWDAVVLLDEADVFLSQRTDTDLTRNAIASIFLRELEYYQGILILTTNRLTSFDNAFQSRIHFCIQYPDLSDEGRESVWRNFLARTKQNPNLVVDIEEEDYHRLGALKLNGRQIKNVMSVSQSVAAKRKEPITYEFIESAIRLCQNFTIREGD